MREYCGSIQLVRHNKESKVKQLPGIAKNLISGLPWNVKYSKSREMQDAILKITKANNFDILHIDDIFMASNLDFTSKHSFKKVVTFHNIESINYKRTFKFERNPYQKLLFLLNLFPMRRWESRIVENFDLSMVVSSLDGRFLEAKSARAKIALIPNGVDTDLFRPLPPSDHHDNIAFVGNMDYSPNADGAVYFTKRIFPMIKSRLPEAKFLIVGRNPNQQLHKLSSDPSIILTGYVESIIPYYEITSVVAVPLRAGGGTRGKILEAMALGRPVVSTSLGAEGLEVTHKENIMIADRPEDFATITVELMRNRSFRSVLIDNARKFVESKHSWRKIAGNLDQAYKEICAAR
jgi:glycosyltransferase involved in cell wall biosynthesis